MDNPVTAFLFSTIGSGIVWFFLFWGADCENDLSRRFGIPQYQVRDTEVSPDSVCTNVLGMKGSAVGRIDLAEAGLICIVIGVLVAGIVSLANSRTSPGSTA